MNMRLKVQVISLLCSVLLTLAPLVNSAALRPTPKSNGENEDGSEVKEKQLNDKKYEIEEEKGEIKDMAEHPLKVPIKGDVQDQLHVPNDDDGDVEQVLKPHEVRRNEMYC